MQVEIECTYCGHKEQDDVYNQYSLHGRRCKKCKDSNLKFKDLTQTKIDYYQGCPPFPEKKEKKASSDDQPLDPFYWTNGSMD
jgi:hypothetical protein